MNDLNWLLVNNDQESRYRARMILLRNENTHSTLRDKKNYNSSYDNNIRKWIYRFNEKVLMILYLENMYEMLTRLQKT